MDSSLIEMEKLIKNRSRIYSFLARIYRTEVDKELLSQLSSLTIPENADIPGVSEGIRLLVNYVKHSMEDTLIELAVDYARIFLGTGVQSGEGAYPFESVYTNPYKLVMQEARDEVFNLYRKAGLIPSQDIGVPEDHVAFELEYMVHLCEDTSDALAAGDTHGAVDYLTKQKHFLEKHLLGSWMPAFCSDVQRVSKTDFYKAIAMITLEYQKIDLHTISELIEEMSR